MIFTVKNLGFSNQFSSHEPRSIIAQLLFSEYFMKLTAA